MNKSNLLFFHKYSFSYIVYALLCAIIFTILDLEFFAFVAFACMLFVAYTFRNPEKIVQNLAPNALLAPVDGTVISVTEIEDSTFAYRVEIDSSYLDLSILRTPLRVTTGDVTLVRGTRLCASSKLFADLNEHVTLNFKDDAGHSIKIVHRLTRSFAPLYIDAHKYEVLEKGTNYGVMLCGITTLYLPKSCKLNMYVGKRVNAAETLIGHFL